jgi:hypothetical protein
MDAKASCEVLVRLCVDVGLFLYVDCGAYVVEMLAKAFPVLAGLDDNDIPLGIVLLLWSHCHVTIKSS